MPWGPWADSEREALTAAAMAIYDADAGVVVVVVADAG